MTWLMSRRTFAKLSAVAGATPLVAGPAEEERLQSELLLRIVLEARPPTTVGDRLIVDVSGGTFEGPRLKGTILGPSGDWIHGTESRTRRCREERSSRERLLSSKPVHQDTRG